MKSVKLKMFLSVLVLLFFAVLGGGSIDGESIDTFFNVILILVCLVAVLAAISGIVSNKNKKKRMAMIRTDEGVFADFDRSVSLGDDRCKIYFDAEKKEVMLMRVTTEAIKKQYVEDFEFPGKELAEYFSPVFNVYDPTRRKLLSGMYNDKSLIYDVVSLAEKDKNRNVVVNNTIPPVFGEIETDSENIEDAVSVVRVLVDECHGLIARTRQGYLDLVFNYVSADRLPDKTGKEPAALLWNVGNYLFIMDDFFGKLVIVSQNMCECFDYSDIIEVSYEENADVLYTKTVGRTVGGTLVGGILANDAGAVIGGLSGATWQNKEVKNMDVKLLLRSTNRTTCVLHFKNVSRVLKTRKKQDKQLYEKYLKAVEQAEDLLAVVIDKSRQPEKTDSSVDDGLLGVADELSKLAKLKADGILTEEEFQAQKAKLLE